MSEIISKEDLILKLKEIRKMGWIENARPGNAGGVGNTLEDLLGIQENNLPIPNAAEWELKCQRANTSSLITLFHMEPSPRAFKFVPNILLLKYGWRHDKAGSKYPENEMSFRQTINALSKTDRGFGIVIQFKTRKVVISFDSSIVDERHSHWLESVRTRIGLGELNPQPYWGFEDLFHKAGTKLHNCFYIRANTKRENKREYFHYNDIFILKNLSLEKFINSIAKGFILVDFDARTGHNHGTKFRIRQEAFTELFDEKTII